MTPNPFFTNALAAAQISPRALALELDKPGANANVCEFIDDDIEVGAPLIIKLTHSLPDESLVKCLEVMLAAGADLNAKDFDGGLPLHIACTALKTKSIYFLIEKRVVILPTILIDVAKAYCPSPAAEENKWNLIKFLVETLHIDINTTDSYARTALHEAIVFFRPNPRIYQYFIEQNIDLTAQDNDGTVLANLLVCIKRTRKTSPDQTIYETDSFKCFCLVVNAIHKVLYKKAVEMLNDPMMITELDKLIDQFSASKEPMPAVYLKSYLRGNVVNPILEGLSRGLALCSGSKSEYVKADYPKNIYNIFFKDDLYDRNLLKEILTYLPGFSHPAVVKPPYSYIHLKNSFRI